MIEVQCFTSPSPVTDSWSAIMPAPAHVQFGDRALQQYPALHLSPPATTLGWCGVRCSNLPASSPAPTPPPGIPIRKRRVCFRPGATSLSSPARPSGISLGQVPLLSHDTGFRGPRLLLSPAFTFGENSCSPTPVRLPLSLRPAPGKAALKRGFRAPVMQGCNPCHLLPRKVLIW